MHMVDCHTHEFRFWFIHTNNQDPEVQNHNCVFQLTCISVCILCKPYLFCNGESWLHRITGLFHYFSKHKMRDTLYSCSCILALDSWDWKLFVLFFVVSAVDNSKGYFLDIISQSPWIFFLHNWINRIFYQAWDKYICVPLALKQKFYCSKYIHIK